jgi:hypothetical protein
LTLAEQTDLETQLDKMRDQHLPSYHLLACQLDNVARMFATMDFYKRILGELKNLTDLDAALPGRKVLNGIAYLEQDSPRCTSFGADPDLKTGPLTPEDRGWKP